MHQETVSEPAMSDLRMRKYLARGMRWIRRRRRRSAEAHGLVLMYLRIANATSARCSVCLASRSARFAPDKRGRRKFAENHVGVCRT